MNWQPIDTAPEDHVVLVWEGADWWRAYYDSFLGMWMKTPGGYGMRKKPPTHWMEITPPQESTP